MRLLVCVLLCAGCTPKNAVRTSCESELLGVADPWSCTVAADRLDAPSSVAFTTESRNHVAHVKVLLAVAKGTLRVGYFDLAGQQQLTVSAGAPVTLELKAPMHRERRSFTLMFEPQGVVEGLTGNVNYSTP